MFTLKRIYKKFIKKLLATQLIGFLIYLYILTVFLTSKRKIIYSKNFDAEKFQIPLQFMYFGMEEWC